ncbi:MAG: cob(I)yrinic acid a,c-diamide adenosyltransferase [bacterium]|nr:cob(I)yrinic acid a,c-diamide adenosyltransferase [bacterium]
MKNGLVQVYTGDGKGKTTAAIGQAIRAAGRGLNVIIIQFIKGSESGEILFLKKMTGDIPVYRFNSQKKFIWNMNSEELTLLKEETAEGFRLVMDLLNDSACDVLILDEVISAINKEFISFKDLESLLAARPPSIEVILTGRDANEKILELADLVTEMKKIKHPFDRGVKAREGIEK